MIRRSWRARSRAGRAARTLSGVVVGRTRVDELSVRIDDGATISVRVHPELGSRVDIGERAEVTLHTARVATVRRAA